MRYAIVIALAFAATPAFAQPSSGKTDWSKPVIVDSAPLKTSGEDRAKPVEVYTVVKLNAAPAPDIALPPPCDPPVKDSPAAAKPPAPAPCPAAPPR